jgi:hypothetical protein
MDSATIGNRIEGASVTAATPGVRWGRYDHAIPVELSCEGVPPALHPDTAAAFRSGVVAATRVDNHQSGEEKVQPSSHVIVGLSGQRQISSVGHVPFRLQPRCSPA